MNNQPSVQYALMCLQAFDQEAGALSAEQISHRQGVPTDECQEILRRFNEAGFVAIDAQGAYRLTCPLEELNALEVLEAVWQPVENRPAFRMWVSNTQQRSTRLTLDAVALARRFNRYPSENGVGDAA